MQLLQTDLNHRNLPLSGILILTCHQTSFPSQLIQMEVLWSPIYVSWRYAHQPSVLCTPQQLGLHSRSSALHSAPCRLEPLVIQADWWLVTVIVSFVPPQEIIFLKWKVRVCELRWVLSWCAYLKSSLLTQRADTANFWSALSLYIVLELIPKANVMFTFYIQLLVWNRVHSNAWN